MQIICSWTVLEQLFSAYITVHIQGHVFHCLFQNYPPSLQDIHSSLPSLPAGWTNQTVTTPPCTSSQPIIATCCLTISNDLMWRAYLHGYNVTPKITSRSPLSSKLTIVSLPALLQLLNSCRVWPGHPEKQFEDMVKGKKASERWWMRVLWWI